MKDKLKEALKQSQTVLHLLRYAKQTEKPFTWDSVRDECLASLYHKDMLLADVLHVVSNAHKDLRNQHEFAIGHNEELFMAPINGSSSLDLFVELNSTYTIEQFYNAIIKKMMNDFQFSNIGWCREWYNGD